MVPWRVPAVIDDCACLFSFASLPPLRSDIINAGEWEDTMAHINNYKNEGRQLGCLQLWSPAIIISAVFGFIFCIGLVLVVAGADVAAGGGAVRQKEETNKRGWVHHGCAEAPCSSHLFLSPSPPPPVFTIFAVSFAFFGLLMVRCVCRFPFRIATCCLSSPSLLDLSPLCCRQLLPDRPDDDAHEPSHDSLVRLPAPSSPRHGGARRGGRGKGWRGVCLGG